MSAPVVSASNGRIAEWRHRLLWWVSGLLVFETLTGLAIYLLPFGVPTQVMVLVHTLVGLAFLIPYLWYQLRHWWIYRALRLSHVKLTGYFSLVATVVAVASGLVLTVQAVFGTRISYGWDLVHIVSTFAVIAAVVPHVVVLVVRAVRARRTQTGAELFAAQRRCAWGTGVVTAVLFLCVAAGVWLYRPVELQNEFPEDYSYLYGDDRPFAPSLARTSTGGAFDARSLGGSASCGSVGCHKQIYDEWATSAHRYAAMDPAFQAIQTVMGEQNGAESTRYCGGCHDPISLFSGTKNIFRDDLTNLVGYQEGVSCIACHAIKEVDVQGNANFVITQPRRYMFELHDGALAKWTSDFLIRAYPRYHVESLQHKLFKSPEFCAACHKQFIDEEINQVGWVQLQNQYDNWRKSRWNAPGDPTQTIECRECHMPLSDSRDPSRGDDLDYNRSARDGKHRSHRFLGANQFVPRLLDLPGADEHTQLTERWLRGEIAIPEIAQKWREGPAVPIELIVPDTVAPGERVVVRALMTNNKVGHDFPTGPLDIIQAWVEITVTDDAGAVIYASGRRDPRNFIEPGSFMFKAEPVDQYGNLIDRHNLWEMVGVRYRRALFPGFSDRAEFAFDYEGPAGSGTQRAVSGRRGQLVGDGVTTLTVTAKLLYRKVDQFLLNFMFGEDSGLTSPVTVIAEASETIVVRPAGALRSGDIVPKGASPDAP